jgi:hypothetical protein
LHEGEFVSELLASKGFYQKEEFNVCEVCGLKE